MQPIICIFYYKIHKFPIIILKNVKFFKARFFKILDLGIGVQPAGSWHLPSQAPYSYTADSTSNIHHKRIHPVCPLKLKQHPDYRPKNTFSHKAAFFLLTRTSFTHIVRFYLCLYFSFLYFTNTNRFHKWTWIKIGSCFFSFHCSSVKELSTNTKKVQQFLFILKN